MCDWVFSGHSDTTDENQTASTLPNDDFWMVPYS